MPRTDRDRQRWRGPDLPGNWKARRIGRAWIMRGPCGRRRRRRADGHRTVLCGGMQRGRARAGINPRRDHGPGLGNGPASRSCSRLASVWRPRGKLTVSWRIGRLPPAGPAGRSRSGPRLGFQYRFGPDSQVEKRNASPGRCVGVGLCWIGHLAASGPRRCVPSPCGKVVPPDRPAPDPPRRALASRGLGPTGLQWIFHVGGARQCLARSRPAKLSPVSVRRRPGMVMVMPGTCEARDAHALPFRKMLGIRWGRHDGTCSARLTWRESPGRTGRLDRPVGKGVRFTRRG